MTKKTYGWVFNLAVKCSEAGMEEMALSGNSRLVPLPQACFQFRPLCQSVAGNEGHTATQLTLTLYSLKVKWYDSL